MSLTDEERAIIDALGDIYNRITALPIEHGNEFEDVATHIHHLQRDIMARPMRRLLRTEGRNLDNAVVRAEAGE